jgi:hypothetical protein
MKSNAVSRSLSFVSGLSSAIIICDTVTEQTAVSPRIYPTGVTVYHPARSYNSFICFSAPDGNTHLVDMDGNEVHLRPHVGLPGNVIDPKLVVRQYRGANSGRPVWSFFSSFVSNAQRLPNGNTLIDEGMDGRFFQITPDGDIVWEYVPPYTGKKQIGGKPFVVSLVFRA